MKSNQTKQYKHLNKHIFNDNLKTPEQANPFKTNKLAEIKNDYYSAAGGQFGAGTSFSPF